MSKRCSLAGPEEQLVSTVFVFFVAAVHKPAWFYQNGNHGSTEPW